VVIRGLDIFGVNPPSNGVRFISQGTLHIEDTVIRRFNAANSFGVSFQPSTGVGNLYISNSTITQNGNGLTGGGVLVKPTSVGVARVVIEDSRIQNNAHHGLSVDTTGYTGAGIAVTVNNTQISATVGDGILALAPAATSSITMMVVGSLIANNSGIGIGANGSTVRIRVGTSTITGNSFTAGAGIIISNGAFINTYGDNRLNGNASDGLFTSPAILTQ
jgi:hypothetical protein